WGLWDGEEGVDDERHADDEEECGLQIWIAGEDLQIPGGGDLAVQEIDEAAADADEERALPALAHRRVDHGGVHRTHRDPADETEDQSTKESEMHPFFRVLFFTPAWARAERKSTLFFF